MYKYDYSFLKDAVPRNIVNLTNIIIDLRSREEFQNCNIAMRLKASGKKR